VNERQTQLVRIVAFAFAASPACGAEPDLDAWQGEHVLYERDPASQECRGTHAWVDNFVPFVAGELGVDVSELEMMNYRWVAEEDLNCREGVPGCAGGTIAWAAAPFLLHELVHTVMNGLGYPYQPFFGEGIAYALDPWSGDRLDYRYVVAQQNTDLLPDPRSWMTISTRDLHYVMAGSFVKFLLARHGPAPSSSSRVRSTGRAT
jgi:hypothetical protein